MPLSVSSALADGAWDREHAISVMERESVDAPALLAHLDAGLRPVPSEWLAERLRILWKSSVPSNNLDAKSWVHETGRLLSDLPTDIVAEAIDTAVRNSLRGFMPTVGEIRAIAVPLFERRKQQVDRMRVVVHGELARPRYPWEPPERNIAPEDLCSPEQAAQILRDLERGRFARSNRNKQGAA